MDSDDQTTSFFPQPGDEYGGTLDSVSEYGSQSWLQRLANAASGGLVGLALIVATVFGLSWNEGRAVQTARSLTEGASAVRNADPAQVDQRLEGKLIHLAGEMTTGAKLVDPDFLVEVQGVRLVRTVETFQWQEARHTSTERRLGGSEETITTFSYGRAWSDHGIDSSRFHEPAGHRNPTPRFKGFETAAKDARLGAYRPGPGALQQLPAREVVRVESTAADRVRTLLGTRYVQAVDGRLYIGVDPDAPRIGDMRVEFTVMADGPVTLIGRQTGADVTAFQTKAGDSLLLSAAGIVPAADLFRSAQAENDVVTWVLRLVLLFLMCCGWRLLFRPLVVVGDIIPAIGTLIGFGTGLLSMLLTLVLGPLVIAVAWLAFRPLVGVAVLCAAMTVAVGLQRLAAARHRRNVVPGPFAIQGL